MREDSRRARDRSDDLCRGGVREAGSGPEWKNYGVGAMRDIRWASTNVGDLFSVVQKS